MPAYLETETVDALTTGIQTKFEESMESLAALPQAWKEIATEVPSDGEGELYDWLLDITPMREWLGDKIVDGLRGRQYYVINKDYEKTIGVDRNKVNDRRIGAQINVGAALARAANQHDDKSVFDALVLSDTGPEAYDGLSLFNASHLTDAEDSASTTFSNIDSAGDGKNWWAVDMRHGVGPIILQRRTPYEFVSLTRREDMPNFMNRKLLYSVEARLRAAAGLPQVCYQSNQTLSAANFDTVVQAMGAIVGPDGEPLNIVPTHVIVGRSNYRTARILFANDAIAGAALSATEAADKGMVQIVYSPRLP
jgi:phage major head subunit gpT-like protein